MPLLRASVAFALVLTATATAHASWFSSTFAYGHVTPDPTLNGYGYTSQSIDGYGNLSVWSSVSRNGYLGQDPIAVGTQTSTSVVGVEARLEDLPTGRYEAVIRVRLSYAIYSTSVASPLASATAGAWVEADAADCTDGCEIDERTDHRTEIARCDWSRGDPCPQDGTEVHVPFTVESLGRTIVVRAWVKAAAMVLGKGSAYVQMWGGFGQVAVNAVA